jgi:CHAT domain-containing protein/predicted negative regulator of RcsB-dependent stress response
MKMTRLLSLNLLLMAITPLHAAQLETNLQYGLACKQQGLLYQAQQSLEKEQVNENPEQRTQAMGELGSIYLQLHRYHEAKPLLEQAFEQSPDAKKAYYANLLGNLYTHQNESTLSQSYYTKALALAVNDKVLNTRIALNYARGLPTSEHLLALVKINHQVDEILDTKEQILLRLNLGEQARALGQNGLALAYISFEKARDMSVTQSPRMQAESLDALASLYEDQKRNEEALHLTWQALSLMQSSNERDVLFDLEWRQGRLLHQQGQTAQARAAYQRAVDHLEMIRQDIPVDYENGQSSFRQTLEPVYLGLADLLLEQAKLEVGENKQQLLRKARDTVELIKQTELEDFLGSRCRVESARQTQIEQIDPKTAVIYPIILPERLELLVGTHEGLFEFVVPVDAATFNTQAQKMARNLRNKLPSNLALKLYSWLVSPAESLLTQQGIETLVFVPDGSLRLVPMAALFNGKEYLIEKYAIATSPGLTLFDPKPFLHSDLHALLLGMSDPGAVVEKLSEPIIRGFLNVDADEAQANAAELTENSRNLSDRGRGLRELVKRNNGNVKQLMRSPEFISGIKEQLKLPGVKQEVNALSNQLEGSKLLLDHDFTLSRFQQEVMAAPYPIVHIASHGIFGANAENSFLMTYDELLHINELERLLKSDKFQKNPVELLTLSACQTAEGDNRAPLGFAGVALKAHARSALGSLWPISDEAAYTLMTQFYNNLAQNPDMTKVKALQQAQISLIKHADMKNPFYWAPFILVGNWL